MALVVALSACEATPAWSEAAPERMTDARYQALRTERRAWVRALAETVTTNVDRRDTRHPVFHGNVDWHSSVHAHYALLAASRITGEQRYRRVADASLDSAKLAEEERYLAEHPDFEMPYGRAWLLRLAIEDARVTRSTRLRSIADLAARSLRAHYTHHAPRPQSGEYQSASWALRQLHDYYEHRMDNDGVAFVRARVARSFLRDREHIRLADDRARPEFFSRWALWAHLLGPTASRTELRRWLREHPASGSALVPVRTLRGPHHAGANFSRAWGFWTLYSELGDRRFRDATFEHLERAMAEHERRRGRLSYSHWVPQFGIYAIASTFEPDEP